MNYLLKNFEGSSHKIIAEQLLKLNAHTILDLGCGDGLIGKSLTFQPKMLIGIDLSPPPKIPKPYSKIIAYNLNLGMPDVDMKIVDAVCFGDVLEHLLYPVKVMQRFKHSVKGGTYFIISVPNMGFLPVKILSFLKIRPQMKNGPFDKTHLHDFSYKQAIEFIKKQGFEIVSVLVTAPPLPMLSTIFQKKLYFVYRLSFWLATKWPELFAYQTIVTAKKT